MKVFRYVNDSAYHYYVQHEGVTVHWYPTITWQHEPVEGTQGKLLTEGAVDRVMEELWEMLPADLLAVMRKYHWAPEADCWESGADASDHERSDAHKAVARSGYGSSGRTGSARHLSASLSVGAVANVMYAAANEYLMRMLERVVR